MESNSDVIEPAIFLPAHVKRFSDFLITRSSTGIDDSSYPGMYSLVSDLFSPKMRGKVYGILQLTQKLTFIAVRRDAVDHG